MDQHHVHAMTRILGHLPSRRDVLRAVAGTGLGLGTLGALDHAQAGKKRRKKKKTRPLVLNQYGCVDVGQACRGDNSRCCSGVCDGAAPRKGKPDQSRCVPHNAGVCTRETNSCEVGVEVSCGPKPQVNVCTVTTGNAAFCADISAGTTTHCRVCRKDTDCQGEFGAGSACVVLGGACTPLCVATGRTACLPPAI